MDERGDHRILDEESWLEWEESRLEWTGRQGDASGKV